MTNSEKVLRGMTNLGIELGSTRIKAVLTDDRGEVLASGSYGWENKFRDGLWTYSESEITDGLRGCYASLKEEVKQKYGLTLKSVGAIGISAMMHGYMAFSADGKLLVPFRTWRNTVTEEASEILSDRFGFHIPQRWSVAHFYQAILNGEEHVGDVAFLTTLAGYIHMKLTGEKVLGVGDASGMFPIDTEKGAYNAKMLEIFDNAAKEKGVNTRLGEMLPKVLFAGECAGKLTEDGAKLLDKDGDLVVGIPFCPPEGDAGTGMVATNSVRPTTANVSAGTSIFAMVVLEHELKRAYPEIDIVTTPTGKQVAMVHCNNCTTELDAWVKLFGQYGKLIGKETDASEIYGMLYNEALKGEKDCGGIIAFNYHAGEHITGTSSGKPMLIKTPDGDFSLANLVRSELYSALATLKIGLDILSGEQVRITGVLAHGGLFKTKDVGQSFLAAAMNAPVSVMTTAGEGGAWGIAVLAGYMRDKKGKSLEDYLDGEIFRDMEKYTLSPDAGDVEGFGKYMERYVPSIAAEKAAIEAY
ncbi:MAG: xylulokinase [Christensenellales bacterium]